MAGGAAFGPKAGYPKVAVTARIGSVVQIAPVLWYPISWILAWEEDDAAATFVDDGTLRNWRHGIRIRTDP
jgi:hypothetical protein